MVRVNAVMGVPTEQYTIYENLDLMVHPMRLHINDALLSKLWVRAKLYIYTLDDDPHDPRLYRRTVFIHLHLFSSEVLKVT